MSRIGVKPIHLPEKVTLVVEPRLAKVTGPKGELSCSLPTQIKVEQKDGLVSVSRKNDLPETKALHGLVRSLINNMVIGVTEGYKKELQLVGTGYRVAVHPEGLSLTLGFSHPVIVKKVPGVEFEIEGNNKIFISGIDKQLVGQVASDIRGLRPPEPYKGKGVRYANEVVLRKAGKAAKTAEA
jgi:large subunit ribosomal protein L6